MSSQTPKQIGDFLIERQLGAGGMGVVYLARQLSLNRLVALKILAAFRTHPSDLARFQREAQAIGRLDHPNIASIYFVGHENGHDYMAMEYIDGISLREALHQLSKATTQHSTLDGWISNTRKAASTQAEPADLEAPTTDYVAPVTSRRTEHTAEAISSIRRREHVKRCCKLAIELCGALDHAHRNGVIHRDLKPENLMLSRSGSVHVIDFGLARLFDDETLTRSGALVGTPLYMSPEQVTGRIALDHRTDIYSLGIVLYETLTLVPPLKAPSREGVLRGIVAKELAPISSHNKSVSRALESVIHKAVAKDPEDRYQSAAEFADDLSRTLSGNKVTARPYRYRGDEREIASMRPDAIITVTFTMFCLCLLLGVGAVAEGMAPFQSMTERILKAAALGLACAGYGVVGRGLFQGRSWGRLLTILILAANMVAALAITVATGRAFFDYSILLWIPGAIGCYVIPVLLLPKTSRWFKYAREVRP